MKLSVSLTGDAVAFLDDFATTHAVPSRSAVVQRAVELLRASELAPSYAKAFAEWTDSDDAELWDVTTPDGLSKGSQ